MPSGRPAAAAGLALAAGALLGLALVAGRALADDGPGTAGGRPGGPSPVTLACLEDSAGQFGLPPGLLLLVMDTEAGTVGLASPNPDGSRDLGPMQINSLWLPRLGALGLGEAAVRDHGCVNLAVGAWILRGHLRRTGSLRRAIADYHSREPARGRRYLRLALARLGGLDAARTLARANRGLAGRAR